MEPQYGEKANFCDMNTDSFIGYMKKEDIYVNVSNDIETKFDTWNDEPEKTENEKK